MTKVIAQILHINKWNTTNNDIEQIIKEQIQWAVEEKADFIVGETFGWLGEAMIALKAIQEFGNGMSVSYIVCPLETKYGTLLYHHIVHEVMKTTYALVQKLRDKPIPMVGLPSVITLTSRFHDVTDDGVDLVEAIKQLQEAGATVAGLNCGRGPQTMMPVLRKIKQACKGPVAALPVVYRTRTDCPTFQSLVHPDTGVRVFPTELATQACGPQEVAEFAQQCKEIGIEYVGLCCGNASCYTRVVAEVYGKSPAASKFSPDMSQHFVYGSDPKFKKNIAELTKQAHLGK